MSTNITQLQEHFCFNKLTQEQLSEISRLTTVITYPPGHLLFEEGKPGDFLYLLTKGEIDFFFNIGEGGQAQVDQVYAEELVGCSALIPPYLYTATTKSQTEIEVLKIDAVALRTLMKEDCQLGFAIQQNIIQMLMDRITNFRLGF